MALHLVTGASDGIGKQTALELSKRHIRVLVHGRSEARAAQAVKELQAANREGEFAPIWGDFASMKEVEAMAGRVLEAHESLDVLINNAGIFAKRREVTADGFELTMAVNHFAHVLLTHRLLPLLEAAAQGRVVNVASGVHQSGHLSLEDLALSKGWSGYGAYASSKLANVLFTAELAKRLKGTKVTTYSLHPGVIHTKLLTQGFGGGGADLASGAVTSVYCATEPSLKDLSGQYFSNARRAPFAREAQDAAFTKAFYEESCRLVGVQPLN
jgi:NAD(P)-dependent dehydrogenase (short-subunit alcohol dehydrogenase family)